MIGARKRSNKRMRVGVGEARLVEALTRRNERAASSSVGGKQRAGSQFGSWRQISLTWAISRGSHVRTLRGDRHRQSIPSSYSKEYTISSTFDFDINWKVRSESRAEQQKVEI